MVRTRIAPSPTGFPHIGTLFQALFDYVIAKKHGGQFIVRIEDTDQERFVPGAEAAIFDALNWMGLQPDESPSIGGEYGPYRQSERLALYQQHAKELVDAGQAYYCFCSSERLTQIRQEMQNQENLQCMTNIAGHWIPKQRSQSTGKASCYQNENS
jgi:glutamyl-tRNA synthetase